jgi:hypothetical protein
MVKVTVGTSRIGNMILGYIIGSAILFASLFFSTQYGHSIYPLNLQDFDLWDLSPIGKYNAGFIWGIVALSYAKRSYYQRENSNSVLHSFLTIIDVILCLGFLAFIAGILYLIAHLEGFNKLNFLGTHTITMEFLIQLIYGVITTYFLQLYSTWGE